MIVKAPLIKLIEAMNERPIAFNRHYVSIGCGINGALMLSQLVYWTSRTRDPDGWIFKTHCDWTEETGLTRREQDTARSTLRKLGFISEVKKGVPCKVYFKVEREKLYESLIKHSESYDSSQLHKSAKLNAHKGQTGCTETPNKLHDNANLDAQNSPSITESTAEIPSDNKKINKKTSGIESLKNSFDPKNIELPENVNRETWIDFVDMRNGLKKPLTENAVKLLLKKLASYGELANQSLEISIIGNYTGIYQPKTNQQGNQRSGYSKQAPNTNRNVNGAWDNHPQFNGEVGNVDIPEDFV